MKENTKKVKNRIIEELTYIGYDISHSGTIYLIDIVYTLHTKKLTDCITLNHDIYPILSNKYKKSISAIKASVDYATTLMYYKCDNTRLKKYFNFYDELKPSIKTVIYTVLNKI